MREILLEEVKIGEHVLIDGVEYVAEEAYECDMCAFSDSNKCHLIPCSNNAIFMPTDKAR